MGTYDIGYGAKKLAMSTEPRFMRYVPGSLSLPELLHFVFMTKSGQNAEKLTIGVPLFLLFEHRPWSTCAPDISASA